MKGITRAIGIPCGKDLDPVVETSANAFALVPPGVARRLSIVPLGFRDGTFEVACDKASPWAVSLLGLLVNAPVSVRVVSRGTMQVALRQCYGEVHWPREGRDSEEAVAPAATDAILIAASRARASDVHLDPGEGEALVRFRVDGMLAKAGGIPLALYPYVVNRLKVLSGMSIASHHLPQDGQMIAESLDGPVSVRVTVSPTFRGERVGLRMLDPRGAPVGLDELGFEPRELSIYRGLVNSKSPGMVVVAGPTGSGKTTTLYSTLAEMDRESLNVMTLEDPVEKMVHGVAQVQVRVGHGLNFASGLRALLRQDPDVIMIGEIRDLETSRVAIQAASTGHIVLSSLHAMDGLSALINLLDAVPRPHLLAPALKAVVAQRLLRRVCARCCQEYLPSANERQYLRALGNGHANTLVRAIGCEACGHTGYSGRVGIFEVLSAGGVLRQALIQGEIPRVVSIATCETPETLLGAALSKLARHITTLEEVQAVFPVKEHDGG